MKLPLFQSVVYTAMLCLFLWPAAQAQVSINETNADPDPSAMLDVQSIDKGVLLPRMTTDEMNAIVDPAPGLLIFNEETQSYWHRDATQWCEISAGAVPPAGLLLNKDDCYLDTTLIAQALCEYPGFGPSCIGGGFTTTSIWQSFTAAEGGSLTVVGVDVSDFEMTNPGDDFLLSLEVYTGEGTSGTLLYQSDPLAIPALGYFYFAIPYETVALSQGSMYTLNCVPLTTGLDGWGWNQEDTNIYDGGRSSYGANQDQEFEVYVTNCNTRYLVQPRSERGFVNLSSVDTLFFADGTYTTTGINALIRDTDGDTKVTAEQSPDEDQVRIFLKDEESFTFSPGQIGLLNNFSTVAIGGNIDLGDRENNSYNTLLGQGAGNLLTGRENTFLGYLTGSEFNGYNNVAVGPVAGFDAVGNNNLYLGNYAGYSVSGSNNVFLGQRAGYSHNGSNQLFIENSDAGPAAALIYGEFDNDFLRINGTLNLNGAFAFPTTDGTTGQVLETDGAGNVSWGNKTLDTDDQTIDQLSLNGTTLEISLENDGQAVQTLDLAGINSVQTLLEDADQDTRISVEPSPDADLVQMRIAGTDAFEFIDGKINLASANILIGSDVGNENLRTNASGNVIIGQQAGANSANPTRPETYGGANVFIGQGAGIGNYGDYNLLLGASTGIHLNGSYNIYMGKSVGLNQSESYRLRIGGYLGNTLLYGEFDNSLLQVNGTLNINNAFSFPIADGSTGQILQTDGSGNVSWGAKTIDTDDQTIDQLSLNGTTLELSLENDGQPTQTVDLAGIDTDTDDQTIDQLTLNGTTLEVSQ
ncbi:MAG: hypothetical protein KDD15_13205, partial [Lewinella sp.]|nr:hypothetical protein [Lewinella sp.]